MDSIFWYGMKYSFHTLKLNELNHVSLVNTNMYVLWFPRAYKKRKTVNPDIEKTIKGMLFV